MCKPQKVLLQQIEIKDDFKNLPFWGFTLASINKVLKVHKIHQSL